MTEVIERMARAQYEHAHKGHAGPLDVWDWLTNDEQARWRAAARAALLALQEPTEEMTVRALDYIADQGLEFVGPFDIFSIMIDEALEEEN